ncbi:MAG TPA: single-stranded-DNA-specific exonuclease RecJ, partial [Clostridiales bacterium UBA8960]|nr:single-stranded-DNA-specific exonuclease RecJ [Clostridiales bacterium UBA8960]
MIFQNAIWTFNSDMQHEVEHYSKIFNQDALITKLLLDRGLKSEKEVNEFLNPKIEDLRDPLLLLDMDKAVERIERAILGKERIWLYGDYDVDGITSISILMKYFESRGMDSRFYIPDRQDEGYGISEAGLDQIKASGGDLIITVDCGITALDQAKYAKKIGIDLIITDHHEFQGELPEAIAVVNPKRGDYPFKALAGCGVAFKLVQALAKGDFFDFYEEVIDIAALGTIADIVPLRDENRIITSIGLRRMMVTKNPGIQALISEAGLVGKEVNAGHIGFIIAPRINASGRIGNPSIAVEMLIEKDYFNALSIAKKLSQLNTERQAQEREIMESAERYIRENVDLNKEKILLVVGENWHTGIIGIVASKLSDKYSRPSVILNMDDGIAKGSARSIEGISIYEVLYHFKDLFEKFGGHDQAAGLSLKVENIPKLKKGLEQYSQESIRRFMLISKERVDGILVPNMVTHQLIENIERLKPFGMGNPKPQFVFNNLVVEDYKILGKLQNHLKLIVNDGNRVYDALAFNQSNMAQYIRKSDQIHLLMTLEKNNFMGVETIQFMIRDIVKERMPVSHEINNRIHLARDDFIRTMHHLGVNPKFTRIHSFDIIFSVPDRPVLIYALSGLLRFKDMVFGNNFVNYTLHFGKINPDERRVGYWDVVFMPIEIEESYAYVYDNLTSEMELTSHLPDRNDLAHFYKNLQTKNACDLETLSLKGQFSYTKARLCLDLLTDMNLLVSNE